MDGANAPASPCARVELAFVEIGGDGLDTHPSILSIAVERQLEHQPDRVRMQRIDFQDLLDLLAALFGIDDAIVDRRQRAISESLPRVFFQRSQRVLGILLRLIFIKEGHNLAHHDVHRIIAEFLRHRNQFHAIFRQLADVEFEFKMIAEKTAERVDRHDIEGGRFGRTGLDQALKLRPLIIRRLRPWLDIGFDEFVTAGLTVRLALSFLVGDRHVMFGLPCGGDAQVKRGPLLHDRLRRVHAAFLKAFCTAFGLRSMTSR